MELIKRTIITPQSENIKPITISIFKINVFEYMVEEKIKGNTENTFTTHLRSVELYQKIVNRTKIALQNMDFIYKVIEYDRTKIFKNARIIIKCLNEIQDLNENKEILESEFIRLYEIGTGIGIDEHIFEQIKKINQKIKLQYKLIKEAISELNKEL